MDAGREFLRKPGAGGIFSGMDQIEIVDYKANVKDISEGDEAGKSHPHIEGAESTKNDSQDILILSH